jgi:hypothetical protein
MTFFFPTKIFIKAGAVPANSANEQPLAARP